MVDEPNAVDKFMRDTGITGAFRGATDAVAKKVGENTSMSENTVKGIMPWLAGGAALLTGMLLLQPIQWLVQGTFKALRNILTLGGLLEEIPIIGGLFKAIGDVIDTIGEYAGYVVPAIAAFIGYKAFQTDPSPEPKTPEDALNAALKTVEDAAVKTVEFTKDAGGAVLENAPAVGVVSAVAAATAGVTAPKQTTPQPATTRQITALTSAFGGKAEFDEFHKLKFGTSANEGVDPRLTQARADQLLKDVADVKKANLNSLYETTKAGLPKASPLRTAYTLPVKALSYINPFGIPIGRAVAGILNSPFAVKDLMTGEKPMSRSERHKEATETAKRRMDTDLNRRARLEEISRRFGPADAPESPATPKAAPTEPVAAKPATGLFTDAEYKTATDHVGKKPFLPSQANVNTPHSGSNDVVMDDPSPEKSHSRPTKPANASGVRTAVAERVFPLDANSEAVLGEDGSPKSVRSISKEPVLDAIPVEDKPLSSGAKNAPHQSAPPSTEPAAQPSDTAEPVAAKPAEAATGKVKGGLVGKLGTAVSPLLPARMMGAGGTTLAVRNLMDPNRSIGEKAGDVVIGTVSTGAVLAPASKLMRIAGRFFIPVGAGMSTINIANDLQTPNVTHEDDVQSGLNGGYGAALALAPFCPPAAALVGGGTMVVDFAKEDVAKALEARAKVQEIMDGYKPTEDAKHAHDVVQGKLREILTAPNLAAFRPGNGYQESLRYFDKSDEDIGSRNRRRFGGSYAKLDDSTVGVPTVGFEGNRFVDLRKPEDQEKARSMIAFARKHAALVLSGSQRDLDFAQYDAAYAELDAYIPKNIEFINTLEAAVKDHEAAEEKRKASEAAAAKQREAISKQHKLNKELEAFQSLDAVTKPPVNTNLTDAPISMATHVEGGMDGVVAQTGLPTKPKDDKLKTVPGQSEQTRLTS